MNETILTLQERERFAQLRDSVRGLSHDVCTCSLTETPQVFSRLCLLLDEMENLIEDVLDREGDAK